MSRFTPLEVQLMINGESLSFVVDKLTPKSATLLGKERYSHIALSKNSQVQLVVPIPSQEETDTINGTIASATIWKAVDGERDLVDVVFVQQTKQNLSTIERYLPLYQKMPSPNPEALNMRWSKQPEMVFLPLEGFYNWRNAPQLTLEHKKMLVNLLDDTEQEILNSRQSQGVLAHLVAMKLKLQYEDIVIHEGYSSTESYIQKISDISRTNDEIIGQWLGPLSKPVIPEGGEERFQLLKEEITALFVSQKEHVDACKKILKEEMKLRKRDERSAKVTAKPLDSKQNEQPAEHKALKKSTETTRMKRIGAFSFSLFSAIVIVLILFGSDIRAFMLPLDDTINAMNAYLPIERGERHGFEIYLYLNAGEDDADNQAEFETRLRNALHTAKQNGFTGLRVFSSSEKPLYYTLRHKEDTLLYRVPNQ